MTTEEFTYLLALAVNDNPKPVDAIVHVEGDGLSRPEFTAELYHAGLASQILVTGEIKRRPSARDSRTAKVVSKLIKAKVPSRNIITENKSISTREQAIEILALAKKNNWKSLILSAPLYHQPRIYATFIKAIKEFRYSVRIINQPVRDLSWFEKTEGGNRKELLKIELAKIKRYLQKKHVATFKQVLAYHKWKEAKLK